MREVSVRALPRRRKTFRRTPPSPKLTARGISQPPGRHAIDRFMILFILVLGGLIVADITQNDATILLFLMRELLDLVDYLIFWR
jgi:hypothetical protein